MPLICRSAARCAGVGMLVVGIAALASADQPAASDFNRRLAAFREAQKRASGEYTKALSAAKTPAETKRALDEYRVSAPTIADGVLDLVREHPKDPAVVEALSFVIKTARAGPGDQSARAIDILARNHVRDEKMGDLCCYIALDLFQLPAAESLIRAVLRKHPNHTDRGLACYGLVLYLRQQARLVHRLTNEPDMLKGYAERYGKEAIERFIREKRPAKLEMEQEKLLERCVNEFAAVRFNRRPLAEVGQGELFQIRHLGVGRQAPEIEAGDHAKKTFKLSDYRRKVVVLTFSGNWCGPCVGMYPQLRDLLIKHKDRPFAVVSVSTDEHLMTLQKSIASGEITWRCWYEGAVGKGPISTRWGIFYFPSIFVLDPKGIIRFKDVIGEPLEMAVETLLGETSAPASS